MKMRIPQVDIARASADEVSVEAMTVGPIHVDEVVAASKTAGLDVARIHFKKAKAVLHAHASLKVAASAVGYSPGSWEPSSDRATCLFEIEDGSFPEENAAWAAGQLFDIKSWLHVTHGGYEPKVSFSAKDVTLPGATLEVPEGVTGKSASLQGHVLTNLEVPDLPIPMAGLGFDRISAEAVAAPLSSVDSWQIQRVTATLTGDVSKKDVDLQIVQNGVLSLKDLKVTLTPCPLGGLPSVDVNFAGVGIKASMSVSVYTELSFGEIRVTGINLRAGFEDVKLAGLSIPIEVVRLALTRLGLHGVSAASVEVSS